MNYPSGSIVNIHPPSSEMKIHRKVTENVDHLPNPQYIWKCILSGHINLFRTAPQSYECHVQHFSTPCGTMPTKFPCEDGIRTEPQAQIKTVPFLSMQRNWGTTGIMCNLWTTSNRILEMGNKWMNVFEEWNNNRHLSYHPEVVDPESCLWSWLFAIPFPSGRCL